MSLLLLAGLAAGAAVPCVMFQPWMAAAETHTRFDRSTALTRTDLVEASRSVEREAGVWTLGESDEPTGSLTVRAANNPVVKALINGRDADALPDGFNPDHATGDSGDDYPSLYAQWNRIPETVLPDTGGHDGTPTRILAGGGLAAFGGLILALLAERRKHHMV